LVTTNDPECDESDEVLLVWWRLDVRDSSGLTESGCTSFVP